MKKELKTRLLLSGAPAGLTLLLSLGIVPPALAQPSGESVPGATQAPAEAPSPSQPAASTDGATKADQTRSAPTGFWDRSNLFGDIGGLRPWLGNCGVSVSLQETSEYLNNLSGGVKRGGAYDGLTQLAINVDMEKAVGLPGGTFNVSGLQIHGSNLTQRNLLTLQSASGIEAESTTRLWELWYQQSLAGGKVDVKIGQQSLDQEFMVSQYATSFLNATFGWPVLPSVDLPAGGPAYPLSSLGMRLRARPSDAWTVLAGVFDGNPAGSDVGDPQKLNSHGTNFNLGNGALFIGEVQYAINQPPATPSDAQPAGLPGTYKLGFWYNTQRFADQRLDTTGLSLSNPASTGVPKSHRGNYSFYAVADQTVWRPGTDSPQSVGVFAGVMGAPGDRNLVDLGVNAGVTLKAPFKRRDNDVVGLAVGHAKIGSHAQGLATDTASLTTPGYPSRSAETILEATYQYQVTPWWQLQADFQYVFRPAGGIPNPDNPSQRVGNEAVVGVRTNIVF
ncbi:carbohydrate-selective porin, OprB family protein [Paraburkholderia fungorum]|jgi:porin|uniref:Carbohydrate-selective porin, OprB family protein n=1 Tax=Paraburkholderia fungorum TaxID=134537 RepID=A0AAU8TA76_9BURK|nr:MULTISPECIES: carbohydrate porin [Burkholderiaceae]AJZ57171.1 carbohydrate-selective porin, OprB family protein [Paraburkholderia fungorum]USX11036.1 carbohydrate porin [Paraburkholderia fungorum]